MLGLLAILRNMILQMWLPQQPFKNMEKNIFGSKYHYIEVSGMLRM